MRHLALNVSDLGACEQFYAGLLGLRVDWRPDADNLYLSSGNDNLALHRAKSPLNRQAQPLDHFGFVLDAPEQVDAWHAWLRERGVAIKAAPRDHRDGSRSFYCLDPDGNTVQFIFLPARVQNDA
ncbi:MAG: VOC family protein [Gammaproteobacteria bacterium]|nr:MAG: VOC family protein [Gammaproteobacteria bacterium]